MWDKFESITTTTELIKANLYIYKIKFQKKPHNTKNLVYMLNKLCSDQLLQTYLIIRKKILVILIKKDILQKNF